MSKLDHILATLRDHKADLQSHFNVKSIGVFGSFVRGQDTKLSDVDILIELSEPIGLIQFIQLENKIGRFLKKKVDLVMKSALKPKIGQRILKEVIYV